MMRVLQDLRSRKASLAVIMDEHGGVRRTGHDQRPGR